MIPRFESCGWPEVDSSNSNLKESKYMMTTLYMVALAMRGYIAN